MLHIDFTYYINLPTVPMANEQKKTQAFALFTEARANIHVATIKHADDTHENEPLFSIKRVLLLKKYANKPHVPAY
jgi:hypothetical protein